MLSDLLIALLYLALLFCWAPSMWAVSLLQVGLLGLGGYWIARHIHSEPVRISPDSIVLALLIACGPIQILARTTESSFETWSATLNWLTLAVAFLLAKRVCQRSTERRRFLSRMLWLGSALAVIAVLQNFSSPRRILWLFQTSYNSYGPFIYKNQFAAFLELLIPIAFWKMVIDQRARFAYAILVAALFACSVASVSRAGVVLAAAELIVLTFLFWSRRLISAKTMRIVAAQACILPIVFSLVVGWDALLKRFEEPSPYAVRAKLASSTIQMIRDRPAMGFGLGTWRIVYPQYATFDIAKWANEAHNDWLQWASDGGIGFALVMLSFAAVAARRAWKHPWGCGVVAVFIHATVDYPTREPALAAVLFALAGALAAAEGKKAPERPEENARSRTMFDRPVAHEQS